MSTPPPGNPPPRKMSDRKKLYLWGGVALFALVIIGGQADDPKKDAPQATASSLKSVEAVKPETMAPAKLADAIKALSGNIEKVEVDTIAPPIINVTFRTHASTGGDAIPLPGNDAVEVLGEVEKKSLLPKGYGISFLSQARLANQLGDSMDLPVMRLELPAELLAKINFSSGEFGSTNLMNIAQVDSIHPVVRDDVVDFCGKNMDKGYKLFCIHAAVYLAKEGYVYPD